MFEGAKLLVYGTLLQGEPRNHLLDDCRLIQTVEVPGRLYDTKKGFPAASCDGNAGETFTGELYWIFRDTQKKLEELDRVEGTEDGLYQRRTLAHQGQYFHIYEAGELLRQSLREQNRIKNGDWRGYGSTAIRDPVRFALEFEKPQSRRYRKFPPNDTIGSIFLKGQIPILVTASHATAHLRMNVLKYEEHYTGALAVILHALTRSHALYTHLASKIDSNYYDDTSFKRKLTEIVEKFGIKLVIDLHGTGAKKDRDIYPGVGNSKEFLLGQDTFLHRLDEAAATNKLSMGGLHVFPASRQMTVTKFVSTRLGVPAIQVEIGDRLRHPDKSPAEFKKLVDFLKNYLRLIKSHL